MSILTADRVNAIFTDCLYKEGEPTQSFVPIIGIVSDFSMHPIRLYSHKSEIVEMLNELPATFHEKTGGGWSFLNACMDKHLKMWTSEHRTMEQLFVLGMGIAKVKCLLPRDLWPSLPGGMPYYVVLADPA